MKKLLLIYFFLLASISVAVAQVRVTGVVKDGDSPIIGASVVQKGTTNGVSTDLDGAFSISVPNANVILEVSYVGMQAQDYPLRGRTSGIEITLKNDDTSIEDVVVIGYASKARRDLTGSVGSVTGAALARVPVASAAEALQGKIAGVQVTSVDGAPGAEINIRIRGGTSVTQSNDPLYIVDGFPADNINDIPPSDIQSIDVLKDASLTAIYGARGGNGVVVVTTKSASSGKVTVNLNYNAKLRTLARKLDVMDPYEFVLIQYESVVGNNTRRQKFRSNFGNPLDFDLYKRFGSGNDWQGEILGSNPMSYEYNMSIGGGTERIRFNTSVTHSDEKGVLVGSRVIRTNANTKINVKVSDKINILLNPRFSYRQNRGAGADAVGGGGIMDVLRYRPTNGLRDFAWFSPEITDPDEEAAFQYTNPKGDMDQNYVRSNSYDILNQAAFEYKPIKGLTLRSEGLFGLTLTDRSRFFGYLTSTAKGQDNLPVADIQNTKRNRYTWTNTANYNFSHENHNFSFLLGQEIQHSATYTTYMRSRYFPRDIKPNIALKNMTLGDPYQITSSITSPDRTASFFGQANYNYDRKYLASVTFRADGSTKFAPGNQWGYFPAVSGAWVISQEKFMEDFKSIDLLKLRVAIGMAGNNRITDDMWRYQYVINTEGGPGFGESSVNGDQYYTNSGGNTFPNTKIKWETTLTRNLAVDLEMFGGRLKFTPEVYWNTTKDLLYESNVPITSGYTRQMQNIGQVTNRGFEFMVEGVIVQRPNFFLSGNLNFGRNKTRIDKLNGSENEIWTYSTRWSSSTSDYCLRVGDQLGLIYGYVYDGIYGFDEFDMTNNYNYTPKDGTVNCDALFGTYPGRPKFKNVVDGVDGDPDVNIVNENDRVVIGNTNPKFTGGFGFNGWWKDFDFSINFTYMYGFDVNNATAYTLASFEGNTDKYYNISPNFSSDKRWRYANPDGDRMLNDVRYVDQYREINSTATVFNPVDITKKVTHSYFIEDGSFLRLQDLTIGYTLPKKYSKRVGMEKLRVYVSGYNLWLWTGYSGYDPEVDVQSGLTPSVDYNRYPRSRSFVFGVNVTF